MTESRIPVTLIAGYLGAGKTTWLNARIRDGLPCGALILVNDFGAINIDAELIAWRDDRMIRLSNGCICCSLSESLSVQLSEIARQPERPSAIFIETSGVAEPARIADLIRVSRAFSLAAVICLINGRSLGQLENDARVATLVVGQIAAADHLSINRIDDFDSRQVAELDRRLLAINPMARRETADRVEPETMVARPPTPLTPMPSASASKTDWARFAVRKPHPVARGELESVFDRYDDVLARAKGLLWEGDGCVVCQRSAGRTDWSPSVRRAGVGQLVGIGFKGPRFDALVAEIKAL